MKKEIFKKAHNLTKGIIKKGDSYRATFKLALSFVYSQLKKSTNSIEEKLVSKGFKVWENYGYRRIYLNNIETIANMFGVEMTFSRAAKGVAMYYDCQTGSFCYNCSSSRKSFVESIINAIRNN